MDDDTDGYHLRLKDYTAPAFLIEEIELDIARFDDRALVRAKLVVEKKSEAVARRAVLQLDVDELTLVSVALDGAALSANRYAVDERHLTVTDVPDGSELETVCRIHPAGRRSRELSASRLGWPKGGRHCSHRPGAALSACRL